MSFATIMIIYHYVGLGYLVAAYFGPRDRLKRAAVGAAILLVVALLYFPILAQGAVFAPPRALLGLWVLPALAGFGVHMLVTRVLAVRNAPLKRTVASGSGPAPAAGGDSVERTVARLDGALQRGDLTGALDCYDEDAVVMLESGRVVRGKSELKSALGRLLGSGLAATHHPQVLETGDTALYLARWSPAGKSGPTNGHTPRSYTAASVFRRSRDTAGQWHWRLLIDNPFGPGTESPS